MSITIEVQGTRIYLKGDTFKVKDSIKAMGGHWDGDRKAWWVGTAKREAAEKLANGVASGSVEADKSDEDPRIVAKVKYKGRMYYARWYGTSKSGEFKCHLFSLDGKINFWATFAHDSDGSGEIAKIEKTYQPRTNGFGRYAREEYQTLSSIRRFIEQQKSPTRARGRCTECDHWGPVGETCKECCEGIHS